MKVEEILHFKPIGPDPVGPFGPWERVIDFLDKEKQVEIAGHLLELNKVAIETQKTVLDAQAKTLTKIIEVLGAAKKQGFAAR